MSLVRLLAAFAGIVVVLFALAYFLAKSVHDEIKPPPQRILPPKDPVSELVKLIDGGCKTGDWTGFDNACDLDAMLKRIIGSVDLSEPMRECLSQIVKGGGPLGLKEKNGLREMFGEAREWKLIKVRPGAPEPRPVFRVVGPDGFAGYIEFVLGESWAANLRIVDAYMPMFGELVSDYLRRMYVPSLSELQVLNTLRAPMPADLFCGREELFRLMELGKEGKWTEAEEFFDHHRKALIGDKLARMFRLQGAMATGRESYVKTFEDFERLFPDDASLRFLRISSLRFQGKCDEALEAIDVIDREFGADPYLDSLRATVCLEASRDSQAEAFSKRCTDSEPQLAEGWYVRIHISLHMKNAGGAARHLAAADKVAKIDMKRIEALEGFEDFAKTEEFRAWKESRPSK